MAADPLARPLQGVDNLAEVALGEIWAASTAFPEAWPLASLIYRNQCQPSKIVGAGETWIDLAGTLAKGTDAIGARTGRLPPSAWVGKDRQAFDAHVSDYVGQLYLDQVGALVVGGVTLAVGVLLAILVLCYFFVASVLAVLAVAYFAFLSTGVAAAAALNVQELALELIEWSNSSLTEFEETISQISKTGAVLIGTALAVDTVVQMTTGNVDVIKDLVQAAIYTGLDTATGMASKTEQNLTEKGIKADNPTVKVASMGYGTGSTLAGSETVDVLGPQDAGDAWSDGGDAWKKAPDAFTSNG